MPLTFERYSLQRARWPRAGRHILAHFDADTIVVYQAYRPSIGRWAADHGRFGGDDFSLDRMSWVKPNFLWMMYRSGWGTKEGQEVVLAVRLRRAAFDELLAAAVHSSHEPAVYGDRREWQRAVARSDVRLQWDPDHDPSGAKLERRAIQLGLRGAALASYAEAWIVELTDVSEFVAEQRRVWTSGAHDELVTPREEVYPVADPAVARRLGLSPP
jgi:hypothetical protein